MTDRHDVTWGLCAFRTRSHSAAQLANERCRLPPPGSPPGSPPRRAPSSAGSRASRVLLPPPRGHHRCRGAQEEVLLRLESRRSRTGAVAAARRLGPPGGERVQGLRQPWAWGTPTDRPGGWFPRLLLFHVVPQRLAQVLLGCLQLAHKGRHCSASQPDRRPPKVKFLTLISTEVVISSSSL